MDTASWTRSVQPKDFVHVWTCLDLGLTFKACLDFDYIQVVSLQSENFTDDQNYSWKLCLNLHSSQKQELQLKFNRRDNNNICVIAVMHFLDKQGKIFEPEEWKQEYPVGFDTRAAPTVSLRLPFDLRDKLELLLHNGNLRIQLRLVRGPVNESGLGTKIYYKDNNVPSTLISDLNLIFQNSTFSDVTICSGTEKFHAHKGILAGRSPLFKKILEAPMKEAATSTVTIKEYCPEVVKGMLKYLYSDDVTVVTPPLAAEFYGIAHLYELDKLKSEAESILTKNLTMENAVQMLMHAITYGLDNLKSHTIDYIICNNVLLTDSEELERLAGANLMGFLELCKDERLSPKVAELISIAIKANRSLPAASSSLPKCDTRTQHRKRKLTETS